MASGVDFGIGSSAGQGGRIVGIEDGEERFYFRHIFAFRSTLHLPPRAVKRRRRNRAGGEEPKAIQWLPALVKLQVGIESAGPATETAGCRFKRNEREKEPS